MNAFEYQELHKIAGFVRKLYDILQTPIYQKVICWSQDGKSIKILNQKDLESKVLEANFRHRNFNSFIRQLNMYGFRKMQRTVINRMCTFSHPLFQRNGQNNLHLIKTKHQVKRLHPQKRKGSMSDVDSKNLVEKEEKSIYYKKQKIQSFQRNRKIDQLSPPSVFSSRLENKNSKNIYTKQIAQNQIFQEKIKIQNFNFDNLKTNSIQIQKRKTNLLKDFKEYRQEYQLKEPIHYKKQIEHNFNKINEHLQSPLESHVYQVGQNLNKFVLKNSQTHNSIALNQSITPINFSHKQMSLNLPTSTASFGIYPQNISFQSSFYPSPISQPSYFPMNTSYYPMVQMFPQPIILCQPQASIPTII